MECPAELVAGRGDLDGFVPQENRDVIDRGRTAPYAEVHEALEMRAFPGLTAEEMAGEAGLTVNRVPFDLRQARLLEGAGHSGSGS